MENLYQLFDLPSYSSFSDVKLRYQQLAKELHPDKQIQHNTVMSAKDTSQQFITVQEAWKVLSDTSTKEQYDAKLRQFQAEDTFTINEFVSIDELETDFQVCQECGENGACDNCSDDIYVHQCRCGGEYMLLKKDVCQKSFPLAVECSNCSLYIQVSAGT